VDRCFLGSDSVVLQVVTNISEEPITSVFSEEDGGDRFL
jgi:hypothetical protein